MENDKCMENKEISAILPDISSAGGTLE